MWCMQAWLALLQSVANGLVGAALATQQYVNLRAVHGPLAAAVAAAALTPGVAFANAAGAAAPHEWHILRCSCAHNNCFKVLRTDSIRRQLLRGGNDPLTCPACAPHQQMCKTYSPYVVVFYAMMMQQWPNANVVWDWHDVPHLPRYHFDATLFVMQPQAWHTRFEIDGPCHFGQNFSTRRAQDAVKDAMVILLQVRMLRLHARDQHLWAQWIVQQFAHHMQHGVLYTPAFMLCLPHAHWQRLL